VGKTEVSLGVAKALKGEVLSADSMQLYKMMEIGCAKPTWEERRFVPHHMVDEIDPRESFSVADYQKKAKKALQDMFERGVLPVVAGGTGLYINALIYDMDFGENPANFIFREEMEKLALEKGKEEVHRLLMNRDPKAGEVIHPNNLKKVIRALERLDTEGTVKPFRENLVPTKEYEVHLIGLSRNRSQLYQRIDARVDAFLEKGLLEEVRGLRELGLTEKDISMKGIGYKELFRFLDGEDSLEKAVEEIKKNTRNLAKRQMTWFRKYPYVTWFDLSRMEAPVEEIVTWWINR
jgi:tRNA dimethylallyltransferase